MYNGTLVKIGNYTFPRKYIAADTYKPYSIMQSIDPWTDGNGLLHMKAVSTKVMKTEFDTIAMLTNVQLTELLTRIQANFVDADARKCEVTFYDFATDSYVTQLAYMADIQPTIYYADDELIQYDPIHFSFIGGLADDDE